MEKEVFFYTDMFRSFFKDKLKRTGLYDNEEIESEAEFTIENMIYDMSNGDSLSTAFSKACRDLHVEEDEIENYI